jgi:hypothetical protein
MDRHRLRQIGSSTGADGTAVEPQVLGEQRAKSKEHRVTLISALYALCFSRGRRR